MISMWLKIRTIWSQSLAFSGSGLLPPSTGTVICMSAPSHSDLGHEAFLPNSPYSSPYNHKGTQVLQGLVVPRHGDCAG